MTNEPELCGRVERLEAEVKRLCELVKHLQTELTRVNQRTWGMDLIGSKP